MLRHRAQEPLETPFDGCSSVLVCILQERSSALDPAIGKAYVRPQESGFHQATLQQGFQSDESFGQGPLFATRSKLAAITVRRL